MKGIVWDSTRIDFNIIEYFKQSFVALFDRTMASIERVFKLFY